MDQELTVQDINSRVVALSRRGKEITEETGFAVDYYSYIADFIGEVYSNFRLADYVWIFTTEDGLTLNYEPIHPDNSKDDWQYDIDISQVESFIMPPKKRYENSPAADQSIQG